MNGNHALRNSILLGLGFALIQSSPLGKAEKRE